MKPNYYQDLTANEFIGIIDGTDQRFHQQRAVPLTSLNFLNQARQADSLEPLCMYAIPALDDQQEGWRQQHVGFSKYTGDDAPDYKMPFVYKITQPVWWDRGPNTSLGQGSKPELNCKIDLSHCEFYRSFHIKNVKSISSLILSNCTFTKYNDSRTPTKVIFENTKFDEINIHNDIGEVNSVMQINIKNVSAKAIYIGGLNLQSLFINGEANDIVYLSIRNCNIKTLSISGKSVEKIYVVESTISESFKLDSDTKSVVIRQEVFSTAKNVIRTLSIDFSYLDKTADYAISGAIITKLELWYRNKGRFSLYDSEVNHITFNEFYNEGDCKLHNINNLKLLNIENSTLKQVEFFNVDIASANKVTVTDSNLLDVMLVNSTFPANVQGRSENDYKQLRETFRQLKHASSKQANKIQELKYESLEMDSYTKDKSVVKSWDDKLILYFNKFTNNHGQSWLKALGIWFLLALILFSFVKLGFGYSFSWGLSAKDIRQFVEFLLNPLHDFDKVFVRDLKDFPNNKPFDGSRLIDTISKILGGLFLFQMIRAFRKYVK